MGFFGKKHDDDQDVGADNEKAPVAQKTPPPPPPAPPKVEAKTTPPPPPPAADPTFGIDDAVQLMRQLPNRNIDLVMQVVKKTLESVKVDVGRIIDGATKKEHVIEDRIGTLKKEIEKLETQIAAAKKEIAQLEADQKEVTTVKERLVIAQKAEQEAKDAKQDSDRPTNVTAPPAPAKPVVQAAAPVTPPPPPKS